MPLDPWISELNKRAGESVAAAMPAIDERVGIIRFVSDRTIEPDDPRLFQAVTGLTNVARLCGNTIAMESGNSGAGVTRDIARASAIGESLERYCAAIYDEDALIVASYADLERKAISAVPPRSFALYSDSQYRQPGFIHHPFTEDTVVRWVQGHSLIHDEPIMVPACLVYVPYRFSLPSELIGFGVSTGLCCARSAPKAILGGLYEVIERDAIIIMWLNRLPCPRIGLESESWLQELIQLRFAPSGLDVYLNDITLDLPIPVTFALLMDRYNEGLAVVAGASANLDVQAAALKALTEAAQGRRWLKVMKQRGEIRVFRDDFKDVLTFDDHVRLFGHSQSISYVDFLIGNATFADISGGRARSADGTTDDLQSCLAILEERNFDVIVVDVTQPDVADLGFSVVKVLIPGLVDIHADHNYPPLGSERIYRVPRAVGYAGEVVREEELNPIPHPFP
jgi:ribosomal protein S12 methylthiotransferase accessory factor